MTNDHIPVMANEVLTGLNLRDGGIYVDGTFGRGGYSQAILEAAATRVFGIDRDPAAITLAINMMAASLCWKAVSVTWLSSWPRPVLKVSMV